MIKTFWQVLLKKHNPEGNTQNWVCISAYIRQKVLRQISLTDGYYGVYVYMDSYASRYVGIKIQVVLPASGPGVSSSQYIFTRNADIHQ